MPSHSATSPKNFLLVRVRGDNNFEELLRLPTGNTTGEFQSLYNQYPTYDLMRKYPVGMVLNGRYWWENGSLHYQGTVGNYWSSLVYTSAAYAYALNLDGSSSTVLPANGNNKRNGFSLRCLDCRFFTSLVFGTDNIKTKRKVECIS